MAQCLLLERVAKITWRGRVPAKSLPGVLFINKNSTQKYTWSPAADTRGNIVEGLNGGGVGERWAILNAADAGGSLHSARAVSIARRLRPVVYGAKPESKRNSLCEVADIHLDHDKIHL